MSTTRRDGARTRNGGKVGTGTSAQCSTVAVPKDENGKRSGSEDGQRPHIQSCGFNGVEEGEHSVSSLIWLESKEEEFEWGRCRKAATRVAGPPRA